MKTITLFILCLMAGRPVIAQLDTTFFYGSLLAARGGQVVYTQSHGWADIAARVPNESTTDFQLASLSKVFTAVAVMQLVRQGCIRLDDPVKKYLEEFPYDGVTIRQLLSHTGGLPDFELFDKEYAKDPLRVFRKEDIIPALKMWGDLGLKPGEKWSYSSLGMGLLALVVERVSGEDFQESLATFRVGHVLYPGNDFLCMLYGDAIGKSGDSLTAREYYQKALLLNPGNKEAAARLK